MSKSFFDALALLGDENSVDTEVLVEKVKSAMLKAARKAYPHSEENFKIDIDPAKKKFDMYIIQQVIDDEPIDINEINIDEARATLMPMSAEQFSTRLIFQSSAEQQLFQQSSQLRVTSEKSTGSRF